ncbi:protein LTO1 homolog isoform X2 [Venturia canescens]|uniref:protein LTO1 homolog isoform X2 n=1 Tax=Venturia canescens TaxID=32260 RepID=UPI001C9BD126|nr:protein LTO1 homolog isoform X2 [Venturia canescens]
MTNKCQTVTTSEDIDKVDINEAFERLLLAEEIAEEVGYNEGYEAGTKQIIKGYHLGYHRSSLLAARLGYYYGILQYCLNNNELSQKVKRQATNLQKDLENFPCDNDDSIDILTKVEDIKFKYKQLCSLAKIDSTYPEDDKLDY